jgi:hypothetical protein
MKFMPLPKEEFLKLLLQDKPHCPYCNRKPLNAFRLNATEDNKYELELYCPNKWFTVKSGCGFRQIMFIDKEEFNKLSPDPIVDFFKQTTKSVQA